MSEETNKPVKEFRFGAVKAAVWKREHDGQTFFNVSVSRSYKTDKIDGPDDHGWRETNSFGVTELGTVQLAVKMAAQWVETQLLAEV